MTEDISSISDLIVKGIRGELSDAERVVLNAWLADPANLSFYQELTDKDALNAKLNDFHEIDIEVSRRKAYEQLFPGVVVMGERGKGRWRSLLVAASVLLLVGAGVIIAKKSLFTKDENKQAVKIVKERFSNDIIPARGTVVLILEDGSRVLMDSMQDGQRLTQGNASALKENGGISYESLQANAKNEMLHNTLQTAKGDQFSLTLADGSKVWLNAESSIQFPVSFTGKERKVSITGEAYFEIARNEAMPFIVKTGETEVEVLGTHFNIMAYKNESHLRTTLVEGKVRIRSGNQEKNLLPGEQASITGVGEILINANTDVEEVLAWKNGNFEFHGATIDAIMRQVERWYDVEVIYEGKLAEPFVATIPRNAPISKLLRILELTDLVRFQIDGKKIIVKPYSN